MRVLFVGITTALGDEMAVSSDHVFDPSWIGRFRQLDQLSKFPGHFRSAEE
jgi:hypothetical protein